MDGQKFIFPILVRPNFGQPEFITPRNIDDEEPENLPETLEFDFEGLIYTNKKVKIDELAEGIDKRWFIYPLGERIVEGRAVRLPAVPLRIKELRPTRIVDISDPNYRGQPQIYLKTENVFLERDQFYFARFVFSVPSSIFIRTDTNTEEAPRDPSEYGCKYARITDPRVRPTVLCDIVYDLTEENIFAREHVDINYPELFCGDNGPGKGGRGCNHSSRPGAAMHINYHSLILSLKNKKESSELIIWHITDLHIAGRNDEMPRKVFRKILKEREHGGLSSDEREAAAVFFSELASAEIPAGNGDFIDVITEYRKSGGQTWDISGHPEAAVHYNGERNKNTEEKIDPFTRYLLKTVNKRLRRYFGTERCFAYPKIDSLGLEDDDFFWKLPPEIRIQNPNNNLRIFIYMANECYRLNKLDMVVITGDIVDFVKPKHAPDHEFVNTNWKVFMDIMLGKPHKGDRRGLLPPEEILVPIYTIPGNHDYRGHPYPASFLHSIFGLYEHEMKHFMDNLAALNPKILYSNIKFLKGYLRHINPDLNYVKKFGKTHLIFLDSDKDSIIDFSDYVLGSPSTRGLRDEQIKWLKNYCRKYVGIDENVIILTHSPPINPPTPPMLRDTIEKIYPELAEEEKRTGKKLIGIDLLKEYALIDKLDDPRIDGLLDLKFGTILRNWEEILRFFLDCKGSGISKRVNMVLSGHSHINIEFRIEPLGGRTINRLPYIEIFPFKKLDIPCAVYMGNYSDEYREEIKYLYTLEEDSRLRRLGNTHLIVNRYPFLVETTSLGPRSRYEHSKRQSFREILICENRIDGFGIKHIFGYYIPAEFYLKQHSEENGEK